MKLLEIRGLSTDFSTRQGVVKAVRGADYTLEKGEILGIVGESGSGKSVSMLSLMGLLADNGTVTAGEMLFMGEDISPIQYPGKAGEQAYEERMRKLRGNEIAMIFQDPMTYLNPVLKIGTQMTEGIRLHLGVSRKKSVDMAVELLRKVGISAPEQRLRQYPFELSGGMRQRIIIAIALSCGPKLLIADEPTTALDVTVQSQLLELIQKLAQETGTSVIIITHNLGVVAAMCDRIAIMYAGEIVEEGTTDEIFYEPKHPYTQGLLGSIANSESSARQSLLPIPGTPPDLLALRGGCAFAGRCSRALNICVDYPAESRNDSDTHRYRCWLYCLDAAEAIAKGDS